MVLPTQDSTIERLEEVFGFEVQTSVREVVTGLRAQVQTVMRVSLDSVTRHSKAHLRKVASPRTRAPAGLAPQPISVAPVWLRRKPRWSARSRGCNASENRFDGGSAPVPGARLPLRTGNSCNLKFNLSGDRRT